MMRTVICSQNAIGYMVRGLVQDYDHILMERDKAEELTWRVVAASFGSRLEEDDSGGLDPVVPASLPNPPPNCT
jgi:hypothetical protein